MARSSTQPRIAIVGAGIAGLHAAWVLRKSGYIATIYEASSRTGGRIKTAHNLMGAGLTCEEGGEFIDSIHEDMLALAQEFGLSIFDNASPTEAALRTGYFFGGTNYSQAEVIEAFRPLSERMQRDVDRLPDSIDFSHHNSPAWHLDHTSIRDYFDQIGANGWVRKLLDVAYETEYGLATDEQSTLNLLELIGTDTSDGFHIFGSSDERYKVVGGNQRIPDELRKRLPHHIQLGQALAAIGNRGNEYLLTFQGSSGTTSEVKADIVLLTLPFTLLREVDIRLPLPKFKRRSINELGYGTNAKLMVGFDQKIWRDAGADGEIFTDEKFQLSWDNTRGQPGAEGGLTLFLGGKTGVDSGRGAVRNQINAMLPGLDRAVPHASQHLNGKISRRHWPTEPWTKASYACYKVGQWTEIGGAEIVPIGRLFFAGEHCSTDFQGYMNGGAETGRRAAEAILAIL